MVAALCATTCATRPHTASPRCAAQARCEPRAATTDTSVIDLVCGHSCCEFRARRAGGGGAGWGIADALAPSSSLRSQPGEHIHTDRLQATPMRCHAAPMSGRAQSCGRTAAAPQPLCTRPCAPAPRWVCSLRAETPTRHEVARHGCWRAVPPCVVAVRARTRNTASPGGCGCPPAGVPSAGRCETPLNWCCAPAATARHHLPPSALTSGGAGPRMLRTPS